MQGKTETQRYVNLIVDIGNTCAKLVAFEDGKPVEELRVDEGEWGLLKRFCDKYAFDKGICSSVVEPSEEIIAALAQTNFPVIKLVCGKTPVPVKCAYDTPETLGTDRLAAVVGANCLQPGKNILVIDIGTCITFDFVSAAGVYEGGNISLGPTMRLKALHEFTAKLPLVERKGTIQDMGKTTETAIRSGVVYGVKYEVEGYVRRFIEKHPDLLVYLTGGVHMDLHFSARIPTFANDFIVPIGLNRILEYNNELL